MRNPDFCICENKDADQLRGNREADQLLCFRYRDSTIPRVHTITKKHYIPESTFNYQKALKNTCKEGFGCPVYYDFMCVG